MRRGKCVIIGGKDGDDALAVCDEEVVGGDVGGGEDTAAAIICCCAPTSGGSALVAQDVLGPSTRPFHYIPIRVHDFDGLPPFYVLNRRRRDSGIRRLERQWQKVTRAAGDARRCQSGELNGSSDTRHNSC